jgi:hypothetical protein
LVRSFRSSEHVPLEQRVFHDRYEPHKFRGDASATPIDHNRGLRADHGDQPETRPTR